MGRENQGQACGCGLALCISMMIKHKYGWRRGLPSRRFPQLSLTSYPTLSPKKNLVDTGFDPPIWDQGDTNGCTGHGVTRGVAFARAKQGLPYVDLSRIFSYWNARVAEGNTSDNGAVIGDVVAASQQYGDCPYPDLPTDTGLVTKAPPPKAFMDAVQHKTLSATRVLGSTTTSLEYHFKHCIDVLGLPVVLGIVIYESFESDEVAQTGIVPMPATNEVQLGGHCVTALAYDDATQLITCDNSWNTDWGQAGRFQIPYAYIFNPGLADDMHAITLQAG